MTGAQYYAEIEAHRVLQSPAVAALARVSRDASALLQAMSAAGEVGFDELRGTLAEALWSFTESAEVALARAVARDASALLRAMDGTADLTGHQSAVREALRTALQHGPLAKELAAERADEDAVCPECHGTKKVASVIEKDFVTCPRCKGRIDPFDFGVPTAQVARGRDAS